eukprot:s1949_g3.t1
MSLLLTLQDGNGGFEFIGNAFKITGAVADIDDLKKAIKKEKPNKVSCDADELDIYGLKDSFAIFFHHPPRYPT